MFKVSHFLSLRYVEFFLHMKPDTMIFVCVYVCVCVFVFYYFRYDHIIKYDFF
jgi:hypothetical protein